MKKIAFALLPGLLGLAAAWADTPLTVGVVNYGVGGPCWDDTLVVPNPPSATGTFTLPGLSGNGVLKSALATRVDNLHGRQYLQYTYSLDLSALPQANHCIRLLIHFGTPLTCSYDVLVSTAPGVAVASATKAAFGDITFVFAGGCLAPSQAAAPFGMLSDTPFKTGVATVIDDYVDPASGQTNEVRINVTALVPDVPPNWAYAPPYIPSTLFQGSINYCNSVPMTTNLSGFYDLTLQIVDAVTNGLPVGGMSTQTVQVVNGLFSVPLPGEIAGMCDGAARWLSLGVRPSGLPAVQFTPLMPALPLSPAPKALFAYTAGVVADLAPGQAVTSLNGLTDAVLLQAGTGILLGTNGNTLTITAQPGVVSDRDRKTDFTAVNPEMILAKVAALPIRGWRYTNETAGVRHVGPMAQDFKSAFGLGNDEKLIEFVDEQGVALAAIQGLNKKVDGDNRKAEAQIETLKSENAELKKQLSELSQLVNQLNQRLNGSQ